MDSSPDTERERDPGEPAGFWRRYGLTVYWLLFALYTIDAAREPGLVVHRDTAPYPWVGLIATWVELALEVALLSWILRPQTFQRSWGRLAAALGVYAVLAVLNAVTFMTDLPGYYYVPGQFHAVTFVGLVVLALVIASRSLHSEKDY